METIIIKVNINIINKPVYCFRPNNYYKELTKLLLNKEQKQMSLNDPLHSQR